MFGQLTETLHGQIFASDDGFKDAVNTWPRSESENLLCRGDQKACEPLCNMHCKRGEKLHTLYLSQIVVLEAINKFTLIFDSASYFQHGSHTTGINYIHIKSSKRIMSSFRYREFIKKIKGMCI
jgi:hypothetical protein